MNVMAKDQYTKEIINLKEEAFEFLRDKSKANNLVNIIDVLEKNLNNNHPVSSIILILEQIFIETLEKEECLNNKSTEFSEDELALATRMYCSWIKERYEDGFTLILKAMECGKSYERTQAMLSCMKLLAIEGKFPLNRDSAQTFPLFRLKSIIEKLLTNKCSQESLIEDFKKFGKYVDVAYYTWQLLNKDLVNEKIIKNENSFKNLMFLISAIRLNENLYNEERKLVNFAKYKPTYVYVRIRNNINKTWKKIMQWIEPNMCEKMLKQLLITLLECFLPHLEKPVLLTDFLMDSLNYGGAVSLLALQGVFTLIQKHNITYPDIYEKLYCLFEPTIFYTKYKARLFYLADIFLSSTHLSENLVAAFIKRLARLSLTAPTHDIIVMLHFIHNLLLRHPDLNKLIYAQSFTELECDPYNMDESDPTKSNAVHSSLWEISALEKHVVPVVANVAKRILQQSHKYEFDLSMILELKVTDIFDQEINIKKTEESYTLSLEKPLNLYLPQNDQIQEYWSLIN